MGEWSFDAGHVFGALLGHPDPELRSRLRRRVDTWLESLGPRVSEPEVRRALQRKRGTLLLPFDLSEPAMDLSVRVVRAAFSEAVDARTVRVSPPTGLSTDGGVRLDRRLRGRYFEQGGGPWVSGSKEAAVLALGRIPANRRRSNSDRFHRFETRVDMADDGLFVEMPDWALAEKLWPPLELKAGKAWIDGIPQELRFDEGFRKRRPGHWLRCDDPSLLMKIYASAARGTWMTVKIPRRSKRVRAVHVWLVVPRTEEAQTVDALGADEWDDTACPWLNLDLPRIAIDRRDAMAVRAWFPWKSGEARRVFWDIPREEDPDSALG